MGTYLGSWQAIRLTINREMFLCDRCYIRVIQALIFENRLVINDDLVSIIQNIVFQGIVSHRTRKLAYEKISKMRLNQRMLIFS